MNDVCLVQTVEGLGQGVVIGTANAVHRGIDASIRQSFDIANGQIWPAAVGMVSEATLMNGAAIMQGLFHCIQYKVCLWRAGNTPTHDLICEGIDDKSNADEPLRGRFLRGARLETDAPFGHWRTQTFIAGLRVDELAAPWVLDGPMNRAAFETYIETQLAPWLQPGEVVIADNLSSHKSAVAQAFLKAQGNWLVFLPPYSPDLNPIEMAFSKLKAHLRRMKARTFDTLFETVAEACELFPQQECQNYFRAAGYVAH